MTELEEYIAECDCEEIQELEGKKYGVFCRKHKHIIKENETDCPHCFDPKQELNKFPAFVIPTVDQIIELIGDCFEGLIREVFSANDIDWKCRYRDKLLNPTEIEAKMGQSPRLALIRAYKAITKG